MNIKQNDFDILVADQQGKPRGRIMTSLRYEIIASNIETHGVRWAFDREYNRLIKAGWWPRNAFALACNAVFHRYIGE